MVKGLSKIGLIQFILMCSLSSFATNNDESYFNIIAYNVQMRPVLDANDYKAERISPLLNKYDIVALQESFSNKDALMAQCSHPYKEHFTDKYCPLAFVDSGLSTLSKYPIITTKHEHFRSRATFQDIIASKGILLTRLSVHGHIVDVYNTHMQAGDGDNGHAARLDQARQIVEFVNGNSPSSHSIILLGDFNMSPMRQPYALGTFDSVHYGAEHDMILRTYTFSMMQQSLGLKDMSDELSNNDDCEIERILFRSGLHHELMPLGMSKQSDRFKDENNEDLSDSLPVVGTFSIRSKE